MKLILILCALVVAASVEVSGQNVAPPANSTAPAIGKPSAADNYQLAPLDKLTVSIEQDPVAGRAIEVAVSSLYNLDIPVSRCCETTVSLNVKGKTVAEVQSELKTQLEDYYKIANVQLKLVDRKR